MARFQLGAAVAFALLAFPSAAIAADDANAASIPDASANAITVTAPAAFSGITDVWTANENATLSDTLAGWAERDGWKLIWEPETDFRLAAGGQFEGEFQDAAQHLIEAFGRARPRLRATFYGGNKVLRVFVERAEP